MQLVYTYRNGTVPPPHHYEFTIRLELGKPAMYEFRPGYPGLDVGLQVWKTPFVYSEAQRAGLFRKLVTLGLTRKWQEKQQPAVGGGYSTLTVTEGTRTWKVPSFAADEVTARKIFQAVEGIVPPALVKKQMARFEALKTNKGPRIQ